MGNQKDQTAKKDKISMSEHSEDKNEKRNGRWDKEEKDKFVEGKFPLYNTKAKQ